ncbi:ectoine hydroxylase [Saccharospirillum sp. MSK14-1]|uniref:ectoine hydroxylase n=1 Tax=Saccharospirillum sp. MSK14-1 TaxID=1897632 RepID=UPI000D377287|nr:ectoine hydroxylase [Saccharospirillum sp. MSK14-1]
MREAQDRYPTRIERRPKPFERLDPVVYSQGSTQRDGPLSEAQLRDYDDQGFLFFKSFFSPEEMQGFVDDLQDYDRDTELKKKDQVIIEPHTDEIRSIFAIHELSRRFDRLTRDPRLLDMAHQILGSEVYIHQSRINDKPGFTGTGFNWHSDFETWHSEDGMPQPRCFSVSILLSENNQFNGPLMLIPGSHRWFVPTGGQTPQEHWKSSLKNQTVGVPTPDVLHRLIDKHGLAAPQGPAGSVVIFESNVLHASANNLSPWPRRNLFFVYNSVANQAVDPFCGQPPRPEFAATRGEVEPLRRLQSNAGAQQGQPLAASFKH